jgi:A/G-specific adenine glycosylase
MTPPAADDSSPHGRDLSSKDAAVVRGAMLRWFHRNARTLPWRRTKSFYPVWVSEVMLQQTQVETVIPYYRRFLTEFPTLQSLAASPLERVLELWSGLGYYRRARNLHQATRVVLEKFGGRFPRDLATAQSLPGVGGYTARAVLSIAFDLPYAVLDGNVARVMARVRGLRGNMQQAPFRRGVEQALARTLSRRNPGAFNQALMELGQTVCLPRSPRCPRCPLRKWCAAYRLGDPERFPQPRRRRPTEMMYLAAAIIQDSGGRVALVRGLDDGLLDDVWNFPSAFGATRRQARERLIQKLECFDRDTVKLSRPYSTLKHGITFRSIEVHPYPAHLAGSEKPRGVRWFSTSRLPKKAVSQLTHKIARAVAFGSSESSQPR